VAEAVPGEPRLGAAHDRPAAWRRRGSGAGSAPAPVGRPGWRSRGRRSERAGRAASAAPAASARYGHRLPTSAP
jgi:hypothetical protein